MDDDVRRETQRRSSNLYAFRRLKWGRPEKRFAADEVLQGNYREREEIAGSASIEPLAPRRWRERVIDVFLWSMAVAGTSVLAWACAAYLGFI